jgi:hypothetical protein
MTIYNSAATPPTKSDSDKHGQILTIYDDGRWIVRLWELVAQAPEVFPQWTHLPDWERKQDV